VIVMRNINPMALRDYTAYCEAVADRYDQMPMVEPGEVWRWKKLAEHVRKMYRRVEGVVDVQFVDGQPYDSAQQMRDEVRMTGVMLISRDFNEHPVFDADTNLKFRAVHEYIVHIAPGDAGPDFSRKGELRAYNLHRKLAPVDTWPALYTEVAAQACYANARGSFPAQKVAIMPGIDFYNVGLGSDGSPLAAATNPGKLPVRYGVSTRNNPDYIYDRGPVGPWIQKLLRSYAPDSDPVDGESSDPEVVAAITAQQRAESTLKIMAERMEETVYRWRQRKIDNDEYYRVDREFENARWGRDAAKRALASARASFSERKRKEASFALSTGAGQIRLFSSSNPAKRRLMR